MAGTLPCFNDLPKRGKNAYDDAPDALTGVAESVQDYTTVKLFKGGLF